MLADKTLLSVTLAATFVSGSFVGYAAGKGPARMNQPVVDAATVYAPQLEELRLKGYDEAEMTEARQTYTTYFNGYAYWWGQFLDGHKANVDDIEDKREKRLETLELKFRERTGSK
jgi:hypothetical protein